MKKIAILLPDIRSIHNVGSIFRTADAFGVDKIFLSGYSPLPLDRFGRKRADLAKVALGAEVSVPWEHVVDVSEFITKMKKDGYVVVALEQAKNSVDYREVQKAWEKDDRKRHEKILVIFGNEVGGVSKEVLNLVDIIAEIPMKGEKESLNVSVAAGILLSRLVE